MSNVPIIVSLLIIMGLIRIVPDFLFERGKVPPLKKRLKVALCIAVIFEIMIFILIPIADWINILILTGCNLCGAGIIALQGRHYTFTDDYPTCKD